MVSTRSFGLRQFAIGAAAGRPHRTVMKILWRFLKGVGLGLLAITGLFLLIQAVPYGRAHTNPPVVSEPHWDSPRTRELAKRACFDCHSNETRWPWYSHVAPMSWVLQN